jgi:protein-disulfide isomerase
MAEAYFKRVFGYDSNLQVRILEISLSPIPEMYEITALFSTPEGQQASHWYVSKDLKHAIAGDVLPFGADPFATERSELAKSSFGPTKGPADAKLLIVEFADLECPACKEAQPIMEKLRSDFPQARFVFQSFPLVKLHPWALRASSYLDCIARSNQDQAFAFLEAVYTHQKDIEDAVRKTDAGGKATVDDAVVTERLRHYAEMVGADPAKTQSCAEAPSTAERINRSQMLGQSVAITGTPTLFINGRRVGNPGMGQYEALKAVVAFESDQAAGAK